MQTIFLFALLSILAFIISLIFTFKIFQKKQRSFIVFALLTFALSTASGGYSAYLFLSKTSQHLSKTLTARTGEEIYTALFSTPSTDSLVVVHHQDQIIPRLDAAIYLHFFTTPSELERVLKQAAYTQTTVSHIQLSINERPAWFRPEALGDSIHIFRKEANAYGAYQILYSNLDLTEVYCMDVAD